MRWAGGGLLLRPGALRMACGDPPPGPGPAATLVARPGVLVIAHRGASARQPENTLPAFRAALEARAHAVEFDYRHTLDGRPLVIHDASLARTTDAEARGAGAALEVAARTLAEARTLDAGRWFDESASGTRLPTLAEALDAILPGATPVIERKTGDAGTLVSLLEERGLAEQVVVQAFDWAFLRACRARAPRLVLGALGEGPLEDARAAEAADVGAAAVGWRHEDLDGPSIARCHARGLKVWAYTLDDPARVRALVRDGVDGIITNDPAAVRALLR